MGNLFLGLITSKTRVKLLVRFFLNPEAASYMRELAKEFNVSTNSVREELNQLSNAKFLKSRKSGRQVIYQANLGHPLFNELQSMVRKVIGIDKVIDGILYRLGNLEFAYLIDDYAEGKDTGIIDLLIVGKIDPYQLDDLCRKTGRYINRKIRTLVLTQEEFEDFKKKLHIRPHLLLWGANAGK